MLAPSPREDIAPPRLSGRVSSSKSNRGDCPDMSGLRAQSACIALMLAALAPLLAGCKEPTATAAVAAPEVDGVVVVQPRARSLVRELPGRIAPTRVAEVRPRVSGIIVERLFNQGTEVKAGDPLYRIDPRPFEVEVMS